MRTRLEEISESIDYGVTASAADTPVGPKFLRITDIQDGTVDWNSVPWCECEDRQAKSARLRSGDIVFARTGATTGKSYLVSDCPAEAVFASYLIRVRLRANAEPGYVSQFFQSQDYWSQITNGARGAAQPGVNATTLKSLEIPLPPLAEQKRIAGILDAADALRAKRRAALAQLDALAQSLFLDRFGDPVTNPKGWEVVALKVTKTKVQIGPFGSLLHKNDYVSGGIPLINPMHIVAGRIRVGSDQTVSERKASTLNGYRLEAGDVIMGRRGEMGRCAIVSETESGMLCGTGSLFLRPDCREFSSVFLAWTLSSESMKHHLEGLSQGVTMANLNRTMIENLRIAIPPLPLQQSFAAAVEAIERQKARHREQLAGLDALFASLQHRAFRGEL
jgi:type I restriction enzyme S subunit